MLTDCPRQTQPGPDRVGQRGPLPAPSSRSLPQVAGTWYSMAMAASDIALLDTEGAPLRVYIKELRPTPQNNLEIVLHRRWVSPGWEVLGPIRALPRARGPQAHHPELPRGQCGQGPAWRTLVSSGWGSGAGQLL